MIIDFTYRPLDVHAPFHRSTAFERSLFGAFGSGKTYAICAEAIAWCLEQPGIRGLVTRKTVPELRDTTEPIFFEMLPVELLHAGHVARSGGHVESFTFPNGSKVLFRSLDDWNKHRSLNLGFIAYDEANEIDEETYLGMLSRVRQRDITAEARAAGYADATIERRGVWLATNPNGKDWLYDRFVHPTKRKDGSEWFRSTSFDNPFLAPDTLATYLSYPEPWIRRYVLCTFDEFGGQIYESWTWEDHVVEPMAEYPAGSVFWMGMDPGTRSPTAGLWVYVDRAKRELVGVAEYSQSYAAAAQHAKQWRAIEAQHKMNVRWRVADPNVNTTDRGTNVSLHDMYRRLAFNFQLGPRQHKDRIPALGQLIELNRFKVTKACPQTYEAIKNYRWVDLTPAQRMKGEEPPEKPLKKDDHLVDCSQYLASRWVAPTKVAMPEDPDLTPHEQFSREVQRTLRKQHGRKRRRAGRHGHDLGGVPV